MRDKLLRTFFIITVCISHCGIIKAQMFQWASEFGTDFPSSLMNESSYRVLYDGNGDVYSMGRFYDTVDFDPGPAVHALISAGNEDIYILKQNSLGSFLWAKRFGGTDWDFCHDIKLDASGNLYVIGSFNDSIDLDPGPGNLIFVSQGFNDCFVVKLNPAGDLIWGKVWGGAGADYVYGLAFSTDQYFYVSGPFSQTVDMDPGPGVTSLTAIGNKAIFTSKFDTAGNFLWVNQIGGTSLRSTLGIESDNALNNYSVGWFQFPTDFDPGPGVFTLTNAGLMDIFMSKSDSAGNLIWAKSIGTALDENCRGFAVDPGGNVYTVGEFDEYMDFDPGPGVYYLNPLGTTNVFLCKLDSAGNFCWAKQIRGKNSTFASNLELSADNEILITGNFRDTVDFDPGPGTHIMVSRGLIDGFVCQFDTSGNLMWAEQVGGSSADGLVGVAKDSLDHIYLSGYFSDTCDVDPGPGIYNLISLTLWDAFVMKLGPGMTGVSDITAHQNFILYPNPTKGSLSVQFAESTNFSDQLLVYDVYGKEVWRSGLPPRINTVSLDLSGFSRGIYILRYVGSKSYTDKFILE